ncbi:MAG: reverse transcriptase/maturase family protein [bacterium]
MKIQLINKFEDIVSMENLLEAWQEFIKGKRSRQDVQEFELNLMANIFSLHYDLVNHTYEHGDYQAFKINDPKPRNIHKASVRDRLLHHALYRILYPFFDKTFIADSYSCRLDKGTHKAINRFRYLSYKTSQNRTKTAWVLKCDIRKFFASVDQAILMEIIKKYITDQDIIWLISQIVFSFQSTAKGKGLPLGNLTSQLFANVYLNQFDQFIKHKIKAKHYIRYADDFVILSQNKKWLERIIPEIRDYLENNLRLQLHPNKISIKTMASGVDYLGWVNFPGHRVLRTATKRKMFRNLKAKAGNNETIQSYLGLLGHGNARKLESKISNCAIF